VTQVEQVAGGGDRAAPVGRAHRRHRVLRLAGRVEHHQRDGTRGQDGVLVGGEAHAHGDHAGRPPGQQVLRPGTPRRRLVYRVGEADGEMVGAGDALDAVHGLDRQVALHPVEDDFDTGGARHLFGTAVSVLAQHRLDPPPGIRGHARTAIEHFGHCRRRYAGEPRDRRHRLLALPALALPGGRGRVGRARAAALADLAEQAGADRLGLLGRRGPGRDGLHEVAPLLRGRVDAGVHPHAQGTAGQSLYLAACASRPDRHGAKIVPI
jgi:hypothetical protein